MDVRSIYLRQNLPVIARMVKENDDTVICEITSYGDRIYSTHEMSRNDATEWLLKAATDLRRFVDAIIDLRIADTIPTQNITMGIYVCEFYPNDSIRIHLEGIREAWIFRHRDNGLLDGSLYDWYCELGNAIRQYISDTERMGQ